MLLIYYRYQRLIERVDHALRGQNVSTEDNKMRNDEKNQQPLLHTGHHHHQHPMSR